jgi:hypothetical protein
VGCLCIQYGQGGGFLDRIEIRSSRGNPKATLCAMIEPVVMKEILKNQRMDNRDQRDARVLTEFRRDGSGLVSG